MSRRLRRLPTLLLPLVLSGAVLTACGSDGEEDAASASSAQGLDAVTIEGDEGKAPKVTWKSPMSADELETETLAAGDGEKVGDGDQVFTHIWIGNGTTEDKSFSTYDQGKPELVTVNDQLSPIFADALEGQTLGSRVAVTASADKAFGAGGNTQLGIGNMDSVLVIIDLVGTIDDGPQGTAEKAPAWAPELVEKGEDITAFDFSGAPEPSGRLQSATLVQGDGPVVKKGQTIYVDYLGQVYGGKKPFDDSYSKGTPASFPIGAGQVIPGWDKVLVGVEVGSRVVMSIPPKEGYGEQGNAQAGIKGTDTLYFVVDVLAAR